MKSLNLTQTCLYEPCAMCTKFSYLAHLQFSSNLPSTKSQVKHCASNHMLLHEGCSLFLTRVITFVNFLGMLFM